MAQKGIFAYWDSFVGRVPVKVIGYRGGWCTFIVTKTWLAFERGEVWQAPAMLVIPRTHYYRKGRAGLYDWGQLLSCLTEE